MALVKIRQLLHLLKCYSLGCHGDALLSVEWGNLAGLGEPTFHSSNAFGR